MTASLNGIGVCVILCVGQLVCGADVPQSPCPSAFRYQYDGQEWTGVVTINNPDYTRAIKLNIKMIISQILPNKYAGRIERIMSSHSPLQYRVRFPLSSPLPVLQELRLNDEILCSRTPGIARLMYTTISLEHTLYPAGGQRHRQLPEKVDSRQPLNLNHNPFFNQGNEAFESPQINVPRSQFNLDHNVFLTTKSPPQPQLRLDNPIKFKPQPTDEPLVRPKSVMEDVCGQATKPSSLIANGNSVARGAFPWLAAMFKRTKIGIEFACGANLISRKHILSAAHCVKTSNNDEAKAEEILIILGKHNIYKWTEKDSVLCEASRIIVHDDYRSEHADADLAIIVLTEDVTFTPSVKPVCLWGQERDLSGVMGKQGRVAGWGRDGSTPITSEPMQAKLLVVSQEDCLRSKIEYTIITSNRTLCAGSDDSSGPCTGDSGGGLVFSVDGRWYLRGVVSMSLVDRASQQCDLEKYVVFVDVAKFRPWIKGIIGF